MPTKCNCFRLPSTARFCWRPAKWAATPALPVNHPPALAKRCAPQKGSEHERHPTPPAALPMPPYQESLRHHSAKRCIVAPRRRHLLQLLVPAHDGAGRPGRTLRTPLPLHARAHLLRSHRGVAANLMHRQRRLEAPFKRVAGFDGYQLSTRLRWGCRTPVVATLGRSRRKFSITLLADVGAELLRSPDEQRHRASPDRTSRCDRGRG